MGVTVPSDPWCRICAGYQSSQVQLLKEIKELPLLYRNSAQGNIRRLAERIWKEGEVGEENEDSDESIDHNIINSSGPLNPNSITSKF